MESWRMIDTGLRPPAQNIALNRALLEARAAEEIPSMLRFLRFTPSALLGYHQSAEQELNLDYCRAHGVTIQRRITGGGAIYFDTFPDLTGLDPVHECEVNIKTVQRMLKVVDRLEQDNRLSSAIDRQDAVSTQAIVQELMFGADH